jgi:hypothetical protein
MSGCVLIQKNVENLQGKKMDYMVFMSKHYLFLKYVKCMSVFILYPRTKSPDTVFYTTERNVSLLRSGELHNDHGYALSPVEKEERLCVSDEVCVDIVTCPGFRDE